MHAFIRLSFLLFPSLCAILLMPYLPFIARNRMRKSLFLFIFLLIILSPSLAHEAKPGKANIALEEKLGAVIPADIVLKDENGNPVNLRYLIDRPTIVAPVYLHCAHVCPQFLTGLAEALGKIELLQPGKDYRVITLSFDEREGPEVAREKKPNYLAAVGKPFPAETWHFLTGNNTNILKFTDAVGYKFQRDGEDFSHPVALIVLAPGGKVVRYLEGVTFLPFQVTMAVNEAAAGKVGTPTGRVLAYCFSYDPQQKTYVFNILKVVGTLVILTLLSFFVYLMVTGKKKQGTQ